MAKGPKIWNVLPENVKKETSLANLRNILNRGQVPFGSAKRA